NGLAIEPLLQHVEALHAAIAYDQQLAVDRAGQPQCADEIGEACRDVLTSAGVEPRDEPAVLARSGGGLDANAVPFPFPYEIRGIERLQIAVLDRVGEHRRPEGGRMALRRFVGPALEPREQLDVRRPQ